MNKTNHKAGNKHCDMFILPLLLPTPTIWFSLDHKQWSNKQSHKKMEMFWFFRLQFHRTYDSTYNFDFWFSLSHKRSLCLCLWLCLWLWLWWVKTSLYIHFFALWLWFNSKVIHNHHKDLQSKMVSAMYVQVIRLIILQTITFIPINEKLEFRV